MWKNGTDRRRTERAGRGAGYSGQKLGSVGTKRSCIGCTGELTLQSRVQESKSRQRAKKSLVAPSPNRLDRSVEAEACFLKAIEIARKQQAKSLELRAVMSLVRLRQQQAAQHVSRTTQHEAHTRLDAAHNMLAEIYNWFTEGFDTKDLQEAKALLEKLT